MALAALQRLPPVSTMSSVERVNGSPIKELAFLDTIAPIEASLSDKIKYLTVAPVFAEAIERIPAQVHIGLGLEDQHPLASCPELCGQGAES